jgi:hypothetical protein
LAYAKDDVNGGKPEPQRRRRGKHEQEKAAPPNRKEQQRCAKKKGRATPNEHGAFKRGLGDCESSVAEPKERERNPSGDNNDRKTDRCDHLAKGERSVGAEVFVRFHSALTFEMSGCRPA